MGRKNKRKIRNLSKNKTSGVEFEEVDDPNALLEAFLDEVEPNIKEAEQLEKLTPSKQKYKKRQAPKLNNVSVDLHHLTADEACAKVSQVISANASTGKRVQFTIITGKGRHSGPQGSVLPRHVHDYISKRYRHQIVSIERSPADDTINGLPIKGYFTVVLAF